MTDALLTPHQALRLEALHAARQMPHVDHGGGPQTSAAQLRAEIFEAAREVEAFLLAADEELKAKSSHRAHAAPKDA